VSEMQVEPQPAAPSPAEPTNVVPAQLRRNSRRKAPTDEPAQPPENQEQVAQVSHSETGQASLVVRPVPEAEPGTATTGPEATPVPTEAPDGAQASNTAGITPAVSGPSKRARGTGAIIVPWESALLGVTSSEIRAELERRNRLAAKLLREREALVQQLDAIEDALEAMGEDLPAS